MHENPATHLRAFLVCVHDATPAYARQTQALLGDLAPLVGRRLSLGVVPNWHGAWPLTAHPGYCRLLQESAAELLLHGYTHRRQRGWGPTTWLAEHSDELSALSPSETHRTLERAQRAFSDVFGEPARGFLAPAWQRGHVRAGDGIEHVLGFFSADSSSGRSVSLATWTWDCGRWGWLGHLGHRIGSLLHATQRGVPTLAIHPRDLERGFWPNIMQLIRALLEAGYQPTTVAGLFEENVEAGI